MDIFRLIDEKSEVNDDVTFAESNFGHWEESVHFVDNNPPLFRIVYSGCKFNF